MSQPLLIYVTIKEDLTSSFQNENFYKKAGYNTNPTMNGKIIPEIICAKVCRLSR